MKLLDDYFDLREQIFAYFGYVEDYRVLPFDDARGYFWRLDGAGPGTVYFAEDESALDEGTDEDGFSNEIYTQRFLPKWYTAAPSTR